MKPERCQMFRRWAALLAFLALAVPGARADAVADFYRGKVIKVIAQGWHHHRYVFT